ncbi:MarR family transcriptional regulator [Kribbella kalugense]|uniref:DNA-binding MarR family transcriptional regulator n=1 Tax=Kribbella kalugense TaxID=2512221 RepID=A0A4R7ZZL6_9ACTN|nr:helix-turn-helix domain-containing protein [Kribbella kalugense]TDW22418.1 DNA-binding MarR family transcriptional regulator [Kribbella kalugense]
MNGVDLFLLGRALMRIGEDALPEPPGGAAKYAGSARMVLIVASDIAEHPETAVGEIAARTGLPQSQVSTAIARLKEAGAVITTTDPADRRRALVSRAAGVSDRLAEVRATSIEPALAKALGTDDPARVAELSRALDQLVRDLLPNRSAS